MEKTIVELLDAVDEVSASENNEGCSKNLTVIGYKPFTRLLQSARKVKKLLEKGNKGKITLTLTAAEAKTIEAALKSGIDWSMDYFMFAKGDSYNDGNSRLNGLREKIAHRLLR